MLLLSCKNSNTGNRIIIPKETYQTTVSLKQTSQSNTKLSWTAPSHWIANSNTGMRLASYQLTKNNQSIDISVTKFPGQTGSLLSNTNRWRNQLGLPPIQLKDLNKFIQNKRNSLFEYQLIRITNSESNQMSVIALIRHEGFSWFSK